MEETIQSVQLLIDEHKKIKRMLKVIRGMCLEVYNKKGISYDDFYNVIDFVRNYADKHHHSKEEEIFFKEMEEQLGEPLKSGPILAMYSEHDLGRLYMKNLERALEESKDGVEKKKLDIIANAISYTDLLKRHIDKEDKTIYVYGQKNLSKKSLKKVEEKMMAIEDKAFDSGIQNKYINMLNKLEEKYL
jgi:hemerythrin-like domain-containing protein